MIEPRSIVFYCAPGLRKFKQDLFDRIGATIQKAGGIYARCDLTHLRNVPEGMIPVVGCQPETTELIAEWRKTGQSWVYFDRGYARRVFACWLPRAKAGSGYYRWHINSFQQQTLWDAPGDRWKALDIHVQPWRKVGKHIVIAAPTATYSRFHRCESWIADTIDALARVTDRQLVIRHKETKRSLQADLEGCHALVAHASIAAVEAVVEGYPVFVHPDSAAALVGRTDLKLIEQPVRPDRTQWLNCLAYAQYDERELIDGTLWRLIR